MQLFSVYGTIGLDDRQFQQGINNATREGKGFGATMKDVGKTVAKAGLAIGAAVKGIGIAAISVGSQWEQSMNQIRNQTGMTADDMDTLNIAFRDMAMRGQFSAHEIAGAFKSVAVAGQDSAHGVNIMEAAMSLAGATGNQLGNAAYFLGNYLLKVGKDASYAERFTNVFAEAVRHTNIPLNDLQNYLFRSNVTLQAVNVTTEESTALFGLLYQRGIRGAQAYSGLENAMRALLVPTYDQLDALGRLGVAREDENGKLRDGVAFMTDVGHALSTLEGAQLAYYTQLLGSTQMGAAFLGGMVEIRDELPVMIDALGNAGSAAQMAADNQLSFNQALGMMRAAGNDALITIWEIIRAPISDAAADAAGQFAELAKRMRGAGPHGEAGDLHPYILKLGDAITKMVQGIMNLVTAIVPVIVEWLPKLITIVVSVVENIIRFRNVIYTAVAAFAAWKIGLKAWKTYMNIAPIITKAAAAIKGLTAAQALQTTATKAATVAKAAFNTVMKMNPMGAVLAAVVALTAGIVTLVKWMGRESEEARIAREENERRIESINRLTNAISKSADAHDARVRSIEADAQISQRLMHNIMELNAVEEKSEHQRAQLLMYTNKLTDLMPEFNDYIDEQTGLLTLSNDAIAHRIDLIIEEARVAALRERAIDLAREQIAIEDKLYDLIAEHDRLKEIGHQRRIERGSENIVLYQHEIDALENVSVQIRELKETRDENSAAIERNSRRIIENTASIAESTAMSAEYRATIDRAKEAIERQSNATRRAIAEIDEQRRITQRAREGLAEYKYTTNDAINSLSRLERAQREMNDSNRLSYRTVMDMIDAGYARALQIDHETGAVRLNEQAYIALSQARINEQIVALEASRARAAEIPHFQEIERAIRSSAGAHADYAIAQMISQAATRDSVLAYEAQIAMLTSLRDSLTQTDTVSQITAQRRAERERAAEQAAREREQAEREAAQAVKTARRDQLQATLDYLDHRKFWEGMAASEIVAVWEDAYHQLEAGTAERERAERALHTARIQLLDDELKAVTEMRTTGQKNFYEELKELYRIRDAHEENAKKIIEIDRTINDSRQSMNQTQKDALREMERLEMEYLQAVERRTDELLRTFDMFREVNLQETNVDRAREAVERATEAYERQRAELEQAKIAMRNADRESREFEQAQERVATANERVAIAQTELTAATENAARSQAQIMGDNIENQLAMFADFEEELGILAERGVYEGVIEHFRAMGKTSVSYLRELNASSDEELSRLGDLYQQKHAEARRLAVDELVHMRKDVDDQIAGMMSDLAINMESRTNPIGVNAIQGIIQGWESNVPTFFATVDRTMQEAVRRANAAQGARSPARKWMAVADNSIDGYLVEWKKREKEIHNTIHGTFNNITAMPNPRYSNPYGGGIANTAAVAHAQPRSTTNHITLRVNLDEVDSVQKVVDLVDNWTHSQTVIVEVA